MFGRTLADKGRERNGRKSMGVAIAIGGLVLAGLVLDKGLTLLMDRL